MPTFAQAGLPGLRRRPLVRAARARGYAEGGRRPAQRRGREDPRDAGLPREGGRAGAGGVRLDARAVRRDAERGVGEVRAHRQGRGHHTRVAMTGEAEEHRQPRAPQRALMDEAGLDALVLRSGQNFTYLSGVVYPGTLQRHMDLTDSTRPVMLVWPRNGKPVIVANKIAAGPGRSATAGSTTSCCTRPTSNRRRKSSPRCWRTWAWRQRQGRLREGLLERRALGGDAEGAAEAEDGATAPRLMDRVRWIKTDEEVAADPQGGRPAGRRLPGSVQPHPRRATPSGRCTPTSWAPACASASSGRTASSTCSGTPCPTAARATW